jgi:hypothetical protein
VFFRRAASAVTPACSRANSSSLRIASEVSKFDGNSTGVRGLCIVSSAP